jgi:hypothetical protein
MPQNTTGAPRAPRRSLAVVAGAAVGGAMFAGLAAAGMVDRADHAATPEALIERPACSAPPRTPAPPSASGQDAGAAVGVTVRPTALVHVDARGRVTAAWTNTGCAPRRTDDLFVHRVDGSIRPGDRDLAARRWIGDFRNPGVLVAQHATG